jgi:hypothetical protein
MALHIVDAFYASISLALIYYIMRKSNVKYPIFFTLGLFTVGYFVSKLLFGRAFVVAVALLFLEMFLAVEKKYKVLFAVVVFHILWHQNTYFMPIIVVGMIEVSRYLVENKIYWKNLIVTGIATIVGMAFFPGFPNSLIGWMQNIFKIQSTNVAEVGAKSMGGGELASKDFMSIFINQEILLVLFVFCTTVVLYLYAAQKKEGVMPKKIILQKQFIWVYGLFILVISTLLGSIAISGRFFDFFIPTLFILSGFLFTIISDIQKINIEKSLSIFLKLGIIVVLFILVMNTFISIYIKANRFDYTPSQKTAQWIEKNSDTRERVFLDNWSIFTFMFFENSYNVYATGIEPMALKYHDESLYWKYYNMHSYAYYCEEQGDCKDELDQVKKYLSSASEEMKNKFEKANGQKIVNSIKNDFDSKFIVSTSKPLTAAILLNPELIEKHIKFKSDKFRGPFMEYDVFKLK